MNWDELSGLHQGETVWVLGSGPSLNFLTAEFFADKVTVSTNHSAKVLGHKADYAFTHYHRVAKHLLADTGCVVTIDKDTESGGQWADTQDERLVLAPTPHPQPPGAGWNPITSHRPKPGQVVYGSSSIHGAMHLAAHLGAHFIMMVGADCGTIDGQHRVTGYPEGAKLWDLYNTHHKLMKDYLEKEYPVKIHSLNPFINLNLEGHTFQGVS